MTNEVPPRSFASERNDFFFGFLNAVLAQISDAYLERHP
jgi:hypothetical protein